ncbi:FtsX-like permease family protein [Kitasatospora aureofaciens]|uniref:FtsX-like permease family protein n=1 Tax=Kitasatospora aureofaciens TaxID=1894 RepID=UPI001C472F38|nr:FtsX-like permease family protein [Kitasatospora aureofaciens]MBV6699777.1 ABC transporter permease [Kitasatospora aureofaciens]
MLGFVVRRLRGRLPLAGAVLLTVLITTAVLTALVAFNRSVGEAGLRQALQGSGHARTTVLVTAQHGLEKQAKDEPALAAYRSRLFGDLPVQTRSLIRSRSYGLPGGAVDGGPGGPGGTAKPDLTVLADLDRTRVRLLAGAWPAAASGPAQSAAPQSAAAQSPAPQSAAPQAAVPQTTLARLGLTAEALPADVKLDDRYGGAPQTVRITGVYRAVDPADAYWRLDPVGGHEVGTGGFTTYGPMLVDESAFTAAGLPQDSRAWLLDADFAGVDEAAANAIGDRSQALAVELRSSAGLQATTELPDMMRELASSMLVARSTLLIGALQLSVLAAAALLLVVHLIAGRQETENELLAARGASGARLGSFTAVESLLLALPAALLAPLLTPYLVRVLAGLGRSRRVTLDTGISWTLWPVAAACALACILLATVPSLLRGAGAALRARTGRRQALVAGVARNGGDLAILALAALAYQQLTQYGSGLSADSSGQLGVDLLLVAAPTLALCAGTLVVLRLLPLVARLGARIAARGRGLGPALVGWQLARRPARATGPVLLLVMAVATGVLALGQHATWTASQRDQAAFATAGGLRISGAQTSLMGQGGHYGSLPGGDRLVPVVREEQSLPNGTGQLLAVDSAAFAERVPVRPDLLAGHSRQELFTPLAQPAPTGPQAGIPLPGRPLRIDAEISVSQHDEEAPLPNGMLPAPVRPEARLLLRDRFGFTHKAPLSVLPFNGDVRASAALSTLVDAPIGSVAAPLTLVGVIVSFGDRTDGELTIHRLSVSDTADGPAAPVPVPAGFGWGTTVPDVVARSGSKPGPAAELGAEPVDATRLFTLRYRFANGRGDALRATLGPAGATAPKDLTGVATHDYLKAVGAKVGDTVSVPFAGIVLPVRVTAVVDALPVVGTSALAVDLATTSRLLAAQGRDLAGHVEWWLPATGPDDRTPAEAAAALRAAPGVQTVQLYDDTVGDLLGDPVGAAPQSALIAIAFVTAVLAAIGFAAAVAGSARERSRDSALLLALGTPRRQVMRTAAAEQAVLVGLGGAVGLGLGTLLVHLIVPLVVLTPAARRPMPEALIELPAGQALLLAAAIAVVPLLSAFLTGRRRRDVAARLRHVEEM